MGLEELIDFEDVVAKCEEVRLRGGYIERVRVFILGEIKAAAFEAAKKHLPNAEPYDQGVFARKLAEEAYILLGIDNKCMPRSTAPIDGERFKTTMLWGMNEQEKQE